MAILPPPGTYAIPMDEYQDLPALSASGAWDIESECPAYYWHGCALNPNRAVKQKRAFDIGSAAHLLVLEEQKFAAGVEIIDAEDYRTKDAREARARAYANDRIPLLAKELDLVRGMRAALDAHPVARHAFSDGVTEPTYIWNDVATGVPCKARPDFVPAHRRYLTDLKTSTTANPEAFARRVFDLGYHVREAWYCEALRALTGEAPARVSFIVIAKEPPHLVSVCDLHDEALQWGAIIVRKTMETFAGCLNKGRWPQYRPADKPESDAAFTVKVPRWAQISLEERLGRGEFEPKYEKLVASGAAAFA